MTLLEQVKELTTLAAAATEAPWRWELNEKNRDVAICGGQPTYDKTVMDFVRYGFGGAAPRFQDKARGGMCMERVEKFGAIVEGRAHHADWFKDVSHPDAALIVAARNFFTPANLSALAAALAPAPAPATAAGTGGAAEAGEALQPLYAPGGVRVTADELLRKLEVAQHRSYELDGDEAYNYLHSTSMYVTQCLRKMLAARTPAAPGPDAALVAGEAGPSGAWVKVTAFDQIIDGDTLLIHGAINLVKEHVFHNVQKKDTEFDGQEVILRRKGNIYFNFNRFLSGQSWVTACYRLATDATDAAPAAGETRAR